MKESFELTCPVCDGKVLLYLKRAGAYRCRHCGAEFRVTTTGRQIHYTVTVSPATELQEFTKNVKR